jgi:hypothetical protein
VQNQRLIRAWFDRWLLGKPAPEFDDAAVKLEAGAATGAAPAGSSDANSTAEPVPAEASRTLPNA